MALTSGVGVYAGLRVEDAELRRGTRGVKKAFPKRTWGLAIVPLRFRPAVLKWVGFEKSRDEKGISC